MTQFLIGRRILSAGIMLLPFFSFAQPSLIQLPLTELSEFREPTGSWQIAGSVNADLDVKGLLYIEGGTGILVNRPGKTEPGIDLFTREEFGDIDLELEYMMAPGSNSGIYLQGRYEIQLQDSWSSNTLDFATNGGIFERWWDSQPTGKQGFEGVAPRQNVSRAPGVWQHIKISFQAPRYDSQERKIRNAIIRKVELNGVLIHDNIELSGPTRGTVYETETPRAALRFQGDHGAVAFKNIRITRYDTFRPDENTSASTNEVDPIYIDAPEIKVMRSFMDIPGQSRIVHAVSVGSPQKVNYTYDMDKGMIVQIWRGDFLNATPMWHDRGDGSSRPLGTVQLFGKSSPAFSKLQESSSPWPTDTIGASILPKGYRLDEAGNPEFRYFVHGAFVQDKSTIIDNGSGIRRVITVKDPSSDLHFRIAEGKSITDLGKGLFILDDQSYYIQVDPIAGVKPIIRKTTGRAELILPARATISYSILF